MVTAVVTEPKSKPIWEDVLERIKSCPGSAVTGHNLNSVYEQLGYQPGDGVSRNQLNSALWHLCCNGSLLLSREFDSDADPRCPASVLSRTYTLP